MKRLEGLGCHVKIDWWRLYLRRGARVRKPREMRGSAVPCARERWEAEGGRERKGKKHPQPRSAGIQAGSRGCMIPCFTTTARQGKFYGSLTPTSLESNTSPASTAADRSETGSSIRMGSRRGRFGLAAAAARSSACRSIMSAKLSPLSRSLRAIARWNSSLINQSSR